MSFQFLFIYYGSGSSVKILTGLYSSPITQLPGLVTRDRPQSECDTCHSQHVPGLVWKLINPGYRVSGRIIGSDRSSGSATLFC